MLILTINNSISTISGMSPSVEKQVIELLSYSEDSNAAFFRGGYGPRKVSLISKKGDFPTGLLSKVTLFLYDNNINYIIRDMRIKPAHKTPYTISPFIIPYPHQDLAANLGVQEHQACISMPTGSGKSLVIALIAARLGVRTLVVVPTLEIKVQLTEILKRSIVGKYDITVENIGSPKLKKMTDYDCLIIDEAHHAASKTYRRLNKTAWAGIYYRFFLTATPFRSNDNENILFQSIAGEVAYQLDYKTAVDSKYIVPIKGYYIEIPNKLTDGYTWQQVYRDLVVNNTKRNEILANLCLFLMHRGKATLCLVKEIKHGEILSDMTGIPFVNGQDSAATSITEFNNGTITALIGTEGILGEGVDTKPCEYVIIAGLGKAKSAFMQKVGRCLRNHEGKESGKVVLIKDKSHRFTKRHFDAQKKILLDEYGVSAVPLTLEDL